MHYSETQEQQKQANQAVFIGTGADITSQYLDVLNYCKEKNLPIVNMFVAQEISDKQKLYTTINEAMEFATQDGVQNGNRTALIFASKKNIPLFVNLTYIREWILDDYTELHIAKAHTKISKN